MVLSFYFFVVQRLRPLPYRGTAAPPADGLPDSLLAYPTFPDCVDSNDSDVSIFINLAQTLADYQLSFCVMTHVSKPNPRRIFFGITDNAC